MTKISVFKTSRKFVKNVDAGSRSRVYRVSEDYVVKFPWPFPDLEKCWEPRRVDDLVDEFRIAEQLYESGVSVPTPKGIFISSISNPLIRLFPAEKYPAFIMEYIDGVTLAKVPHEKRGHLRNLSKLELEKARKLGFLPSNEAEHETHSIWSPKRKRIYLVDFERWERKEEANS